MKFFPVLSLILLLAGLSAEARLGETERQSQVRYGQARAE